MENETMFKAPLAEKNGHHHFGSNALLWFIVIAVVVAVVLGLWKPTWVQKTDEDNKATGEIDAGKVILWSLIIAFIISVIFWMLFRGGMLRC